MEDISPWWFTVKLYTNQPLPPNVLQSEAMIAMIDPYRFTPETRNGHKGSCNWVLEIISHQFVPSTSPSPSPPFIEINKLPLNVLTAKSIKRMGAKNMTDIINVSINYIFFFFSYKFELNSIHWRNNIVFTEQLYEKRKKKKPRLIFY